MNKVCEGILLELLKTKDLGILDYVNFETSKVEFLLLTKIKEIRKKLQKATSWA